MSYLQISNIKKRFADKEALKNIDFQVNKGEFVALLGPSGCGKTTLLRILAGLETATEGQFFIDNEDVTTRSPSDRHISMVFQSYALFPHLSVKENILFGLKARKVPAKTQKQRLEEAVNQVGLADYLNKLPSQLSGGQRQRVALARSIVSHHPICLMDEPLSNLDAQLRADMRSELRQLQQDLGLTVIYVTHDQVEAMSMADKIVLLNQGVIEQIGKPQELYQHPATTFSARFIGSPPMNLLQLKNKPFLTGIRPEHMRVEQSGESCTVLKADYHGDSTLVTAEIEGNQQLCIKLDGHQTLQKGDLLSVSWDDSDCCYFDPDTQRLLPTPQTQKFATV
ncbi:Putative sugar ABC transporter, ATP-binding protein [Vibrio nigripulchritudo MADA3029]|uniref:ABC transporter ATP-binding protein n=1 Tax=Vibrio nigripulchritudo TaxID=28173 RepID=UPI0003B1EC39|nr:ABC transporter ATP-binding protein [Vibrio nigripulchritudo]CCN49706.1 Putative sugar ABC transporter, ATP-binding protein [Vibrio nigripulchritudo MADA3020]CCN53995.1 Putative sugar ABC transporter, ATP-binding protein [Vibrio nigripulchritudo MADA3021]CCN57418.1 Putative sugar ABC transporter, ATP-binding protein [Vibrio nigripulchritudo MADA3029]